MKFVRDCWIEMLAIAILAAVGACAAHADAGGARPLVIAHRGASGYMPEHTLAAYRLAIEQGADFIEPDLVSTKDGVLVARHENEISTTTDVAERPEFAARRATKTIEGRAVSGWFTEDFTLAELKTLRAKERLPKLRVANTRFDGRFEIPTFEEILELAARAPRKVGVYPETKHPGYFASIGLPLEEPLVKLLARHGLRAKDSPVFVQSFEAASLRKLRRMTEVRLVQLIDQHAAYNLAEIATYADGVGPHKNLVIPRRADGSLGEPTGFVREAHRHGLVVHPWTFRAENGFLPADLRVGQEAAARGNLEGELARFLAAGVDGFFTDQPDIGAGAVALRRK
jgi:glycerophosphoryl diester phosphodiesterase